MHTKATGFRAAPSNVFLALTDLHQDLAEKVEQEPDLYSLPVNLLLGGTTLTKTQRALIMRHLRRMAKKMGLISDLFLDDEDEEDTLEARRRRKRKAFDAYLIEMQSYNTDYQNTFTTYDTTVETIDSAIARLERHIATLEALGHQTPETAFGNAADPNCPLAQARAQRDELEEFRDTTLAQYGDTLTNENDLPEQDALQNIRETLLQRLANFVRRMRHVEEAVAAVENTAGDTETEEEAIFPTEDAA